MASGGHVARINPKGPMGLLIATAVGIAAVCGVVALAVWAMSGGGAA